MSGAHIHLLLTHIPVLGIVFGTLLLAFAWLRNRNEYMQVAMGTFVLSAIASIAVYLTGESAEELVEGMAGVSHAIIERHEEAALVALVAAIVLGSVSAVGLWISRRSLPRWFGAITLVVALTASGIMAWTANLGGQINHPEIRAGAQIETSDGQSYENEEDDD